MLAVGDIVFLQRNLDKRVSLTNNTRLRILEINTKFIKVQTLDEKPVSHLIPKITFSFRPYPNAGGAMKLLEVNRYQLPLRLAYAMTFNKSQGQPLEKVLIDGIARNQKIRKT